MLIPGTKLHDHFGNMPYVRTSDFSVQLKACGHKIHLRDCQLAVKCSVSIIFAIVQVATFLATNNNSIDYTDNRCQILFNLCIDVVDTS